MYLVVSIQENVFEKVVYEMAAILPQCVMAMLSLFRIPVADLPFLFPSTAQIN